VWRFLRDVSRRLAVVGMPKADALFTSF
jgi:hypothetical protein